MKHFLKILFIIAIQVPVFAQVHSYSKQVEKEYGAGLVSYQTGDYSQALTHFNKCTAIDTSCFEAYVGIAQIKYLQGIYPEALAICVKAGKLRINSPSVFAIEGKSNLEIGEFELAEDQLKKAISLGDSTYENTIALARTFAQLEKYPEAELLYAKLFDRNQYNIEVWYYRGKMYELMEEYEKAKNDYEKALEIIPSHPKTSIRLVNVLIALQEYDRVIDILERINPDNFTKNERINLHLVQGYYHQQINEYAMAESEYDRAFQLNNNNIACLIYYSALYIDMENYAGALKKCNAALELDPENQVAYFNRGIANEMLRNLEEACSDWEQAFLLGSQQAIEYLNGPICSE